MFDNFIEDIIYFLPLIIYLIVLISVSIWYDSLLKAYHSYKEKKYSIEKN